MKKSNMKSMQSMEQLYALAERSLVIVEAQRAEAREEIRQIFACEKLNADMSALLAGFVSGYLSINISKYVAVLYLAKLVEKQIKDEEALEVRCCISNMQAGYVAFQKLVVLMQEALVAEKEEAIVIALAEKEARIAKNSAKKGVATPKAPQNSGLAVATVKSTKTVEETVLPVQNHNFATLEYKAVSFKKTEISFHNSQELIEAKELLSELRIDHELSLSSLESAEVRLNNALQVKIDSSVETLAKSTITKSEKSIKDSEIKIKAIDKSIDKLNKEQDKETISEHEAKRAELTNTISELEKIIAKNNNFIAKKEQERKERQDEIDQLHKTVDEIRSKVKELSTSIKECKLRVEKLHVTIERRCVVTDCEVQRLVKPAVSFPVKNRKSSKKIANPNSMYNYIVKNKISKDKMVRHSIFDNKDARRASNLTNRNIVKIDSNGEYIKSKTNNNMPRVDVDYNQEILGSFDVNNSFVAENEALYNSKARRYYSTPINSASESAFTSTNKLNEVLRMNLQLLASSGNIIFFNGEERDLDSLKMKELVKFCKDEKIPGYSTLNKGPLKQLIIDHFVSVNGVLRRKELVPNSLEKMNEISKQIMNNLYSKIVLVMRVDIAEDNAGNVTYTISYQNVYGSRIVELFEASDFTGVLPMGKEDDATGEIVTAYEVPVGGDSGNVLMKDLILVNIKKSKNSKFKTDSFCIVKDEKGNYSLEPMTSNSENEYAFVCTSTSMKKKCTFFAGEITATRTREDINNGIDKLTGGAYGYQLNQLLEEQRAGKKHVTPAKFAKLYDRIGLLVSTPMIYVGKTNNLFVYNDELDYGPQFRKSVEKLLKDNHIKINRNFADGYSVVGLDFIIRSIKEEFGIELTYEQAMMLSLQSRMTLITKKGLDRVFDGDMMFAKAANMIESIDYDLLAKSGIADPVIVNVNGVRYYGHELQKMLVSDFDKAYSILSKIDLLCTKDEAKMMNWDGLNNHAYAEYYLVNVARPTKANYSNQALNKIALEYPEPTRELMQMEAKLSIWNFDDKTDKSLHLDKNGNISGSITSNLYTVNPNRAVSDKLAAINNLYDIDKFGTSKAGKCNPELNSYYLKLSPFDNSLINFKLPKSLRSRKVEYINEKGEVVTVKCNVIYSPEMNKEIESKIVSICSDPNLTNREKVLMSNSCRVIVVLKYPTQGSDEFTLCYCISNDELLEEIAKVYGDAPTDRQRFNMAQMQKYVIYCPYSNGILFNDATMLVQDAGSDLDGDDGVFIVNQLFTETLENGDEKLHLGIFDDEAKKPIIGFISLCVRKVYEKGSICTVISRYSELKEAKREALKNISTDTTEKIENYTNKRKDRKANAKNTKAAKNNCTNEQADNKKHVNLKDALEGRICMSSDEFMKLEFIPSNINITDFLGLYQACSAFGDDIGMTVILSSVVVNMPEENMFNGDGVFNFELAKKVLVPLQRAIADDTKVRKVAPYVSIHKEDENYFILENSSGINRKYYKMSDEEIIRMYNQIAALPETTTREEWRALQSDFSHLGRNLGETSIDIAKDSSIANTYTIYDFVDSSYRLVGNMKPSYISSNIYKYVSNQENSYSLSYGKYKEEGVKNILPDVIGNVKHDIGRVLSDYVCEIGSNLHDKSCYNYNDYGQYADIVISEQLMLLISPVLNYMSDHSNPSYKLPQLDKVAINMIRKAVLNTATYLDVTPDYVVKAMIKLAFLKNNKTTNKKGEVVLSSRTVNVDVDYNAKIKQVAKLFGELFLAEYKDENKNILEVKISYDLCTKDIPVGVPFKLVDGYNADKTFHTPTNYTGIAIALEDGVYAIYNPYTKVMKNNNLALIPLSIILQAGEDNMTQGMSVRISRDPKSQKVVITNVEKNAIYALSEMVCPDTLVGKELENAYIFAYELDELHHACFIVGELR